MYTLSIEVQAPSLYNAVQTVGKLTGKLGDARDVSMDVDDRLSIGVRRDDESVSGLLTVERDRQDADSDDGEHYSPDPESVPTIARQHWMPPSARYVARNESKLRGNDSPLVHFFDSDSVPRFNRDYGCWETKHGSVQYYRASEFDPAPGTPAQYSVRRIVP